MALGCCCKMIDTQMRLFYIYFMMYRQSRYNTYG